jgi:nucleoid-associated protein YgaU
MATESNDGAGKNDTLAFIIGGLFILGLVFATYNYFSEQAEVGQNGDDDQEVNLDQLRETLSSRTSSEEGNDTNSEESNETGDDVSNVNETTGEWVANNYEEGDVDSGNYDVLEGDTLWEIAEGAYGDGSLWTLIRDANAENIDFLPNGQQSLIYAGQTITIPPLTS